MNHSEFKIGTEFTFPGMIPENAWWRCTDVGSRTVVAIKIEPNRSADWQNGPPYALAETVFDEDDIPLCIPIMALTLEIK